MQRFVSVPLLPKSSRRGRVVPPRPATLGYHDAVREFRRQLLTNTLLAHGGNRTRAAQALRLQRTYLLRLIRQFRVNVPAKAYVR